MNLKNLSIKDLFAIVVKNLSWLFLVVFLLLLVLEAFEVNASVKIILDFNKEPPIVSKDRGVRINFDNYNQVVQRIQQASSFQPTGGISKNPFTLSSGAPPK